MKLSDRRTHTLLHYLWNVKKRLVDNKQEPIFLFTTSEREHHKVIYSHDSYQDFESSMMMVFPHGRRERIPPF